MAETRPTVEARSFSLYVREGLIPMPDGTPMYVWGFTSDPNGPPQIPGPTIVVNEGDAVEITLINDLDPTTSPRLPTGEGHTIHLHGLDTTMEHDGVPETFAPGLARQGDSYTYRFNARHAGTYFYHCHQNNVEHQQMGMYGPIIVNAANGLKTAYTGGPSFDQEYTLTLSDMGAEGHEQARLAAKANGEPYNWLKYSPSHYFVNSSASVGARGADVPLAATAGERVLTRVINAGYVTRIIHAHDQPFQVVATDGRPWPTGPTTDTLSLAPGEKYDLLSVAGPAGAVGLHTHDGESHAGSTRLDKQPGPSAADSGEIPRYTLYVRDGERTMPDGTVIPVYGFSERADGSASVPGPLLAVKAGDVVEVTLVNDDDPSGTGHAFRLNGTDTPTEGPALVRPGETGSYRVRVPRAGSYWYSDPTDPAHQRMGMYGALIASPPDGSNSTYAGGPAYDQQYTMVLSEMDSVAHQETRQARAMGLSLPGSGAYRPNYFLINGLAYPDTESSASTMMHTQPGDRVLIRAINAGQMPHAMHLHGYHFEVVASNGDIIPKPPTKDTVLIGPGDSFDLLFVADQVGTFPFHDHFETANTNNGVWLGGMHTMIATGHEHNPTRPSLAPPPLTDGHTVFVRDNFYTPSQLTAPVGATVRWDHQGRTEHSVTSLQAYFDSGTLRGGDVFAHTFTAPGRYDYFCRFHITNRGIILVQ